MGLLDLFGSTIEIPPARDCGWRLKTRDTSAFEIVTTPAGQVVVLLNHAPVRGVDTSMLHWWFRHFARMQVKLEGVPGYEGAVVPAYCLWHPVDHISVELLAPSGPRTWEVGERVHIREALGADVHGLKHLIDDAMELWYLKDGDCGGQGMGRRVPLGGPWVVATRICWSDLPGGRGVHYHYEVAFGLPNPGLLGRRVNERVARKLTTEFLQAWQGHNVAEVGTFENFLPALYAQRDDLPGPLTFDARTMSSGADLPADQAPCDPILLESRQKAYAAAEDAVAMVRATQALGGPDVRW